MTDRDLTIKLVSALIKNKFENKKIFRLYSHKKPGETTKNSSLARDNANNSSSTKLLPQGAQISLIDLVNIDPKALEECVFMMGRDGTFVWDLTDEMIKTMDDETFRFVQISKAVYTRRGK